MLCLLDKVTVRYCLIGLFKVNGSQTPSGDELLALDLIFRSDASQNQYLYIATYSKYLSSVFAITFFMQQVYNPFCKESQSYHLCKESQSYHQLAISNTGLVVYVNRGLPERMQQF